MARFVVPSGAMRLPPVRALVLLYVLLGAAAGAISWAAGSSLNLQIFRAASLALLEGRDPYTAMPFDLYKYSPSFALLYLPFALAPQLLTAVLWPALNFGVAAWGMTSLSRSTCPAHPDRMARRVLTFALPGVVLATDGDQSNMLVLGLSALAVAWLLRERAIPAGFALASAVLVKLFPAALLLLWPSTRRPLRALGWLLVALLGLALLPMLRVGPQGLLQLLASWSALLARDRGPQRGADTNWSLLHAVEYWFGAGADDAGLAHAGFGQLLGSLALLVAAGALWWWSRRARTAVRDDAERLGPVHATFVVITLAYAVLFNHRAESTTFVLSAWAAALYLAATPSPKGWLWALFVLVTVAPGPFYTDSVTRSLTGILGAKRLFHPLRVVPLTVLWAAAQARLFAQLRDTRTEAR